MVSALWFFIGCAVGAVVTWKWTMWAVKQALAADKARTQRWIDELPAPRETLTD